MNAIAEIMREIGNSLGKSEPEVARICSAIVVYLSGQGPDRNLHLTYSTLKRIALPQTDSELMAAVQYMTGAKANLLEMKYEYLDEEGDYHPLPKAAVASALKQNALEHPVTGRWVRAYEASVLVYFTPTEHARICLQVQGG